MRAFDLSQSIEQLESKVWPRHDYPSHVVQESQRLRKVPLAQLGVEDLRFLIGQHNGLPYVLPLAFEHLSRDLFVSGDFYEGDLLESVLRVPESFWEENPEFYEALANIETRLSELSERVGKSLPQLRRLLYGERP